MSKTIFLKLTSAIAIDGAISRRGDIVEVSELEAKNFLHRGKAVLATAEDGVLESADDQLDLAKLKKDQLLPLAEELGIEGADKLKVDDLRAAVAAAIAANEEA